MTDPKKKDGSKKENWTDLTVWWRGASALSRGKKIKGCDPQGPAVARAKVFFFVLKSRGFRFLVRIGKTGTWTGARNARGADAGSREGGSRAGVGV